MGRRGPKPKPTALKRLLGNPGKRTLNDGEPVPPDLEVVAPKILRADAKPYWDELAPVLIAMNVLTAADAIAFARYCNLLSQYHQLDAFVMDPKKGVWGSALAVKNDKGKLIRVVELPMSRQRRQAESQLLAYEREFGLTPSSRSQLRVESAPGATAAGVVAPRDQEIRDFFAGGPIPARKAPPASA